MFDNRLLNALTGVYYVQACDVIFGTSVFDLPTHACQSEAKSKQVDDQSHYGRVLLFSRKGVSDVWKKGWRADVGDLKLVWILSRYHDKSNQRNELQGSRKIHEAASFLYI